MTAFEATVKVRNWPKAVVGTKWLHREYSGGRQELLKHWIGAAYCAPLRQCALGFVARCPVCGAQFECGAGQAECWCAVLPALTPIPGRGCLCRRCLEEELKKSAPQRT